jgi:hypothetical protein
MPDCHVKLGDAARFSTTVGESDVNLCAGIIPRAGERAPLLDASRRRLRRLLSMR